MPLEDFLKALDTIPNPSEAFQVVISGGEPLMRKDLEKAGREIRKRGMKWSFVSNGDLYTEERHHSLLSSGLGALTFSLDGLKANHNWMRQSEKSFDRVCKAISLATSSKRIIFDVVTCVNKRNIKELDGLKHHLISLGVKTWRLFTIIPIGRAAHNPELKLGKDEFTQLMEFIKSNKKNQDIDINFSCEGYVGSYENEVRKGFYFCHAGINIGSVLIDGSISACPNIDRSLSQGNIYIDNLNEVWENRFGKFRDRSWTKTGKCKNCREYKNCMGNGLHNWHGDMQEVLVCHNDLLSDKKSLSVAN
jgi:radical SAM enzyme (rSAM/lipoprotein system)